MTWLGAETGRPVKKLANMSTGVIGATLFTKPSWIAVEDSTTQASVTNIYSGEQLSIYPTSENTDYSSRQGNVGFHDTYGNNFTIVVVQQATLNQASVSIDLTIPSHMTISGATGSATNGGTLIIATFVPNDSSLGLMAAFNVDYQIWKNGVPVGSGTYSLQNKVSNTLYLIMSSSANAGDVIGVYLTY
jgi:hypothetical protein